jgi:hypothetical protein
VNVPRTKDATLHGRSTVLQRGVQDQQCMETYLMFMLLTDFASYHASRLGRDDDVLERERSSMY